MPPKFTPNIQWTLLKHTEKILMAYIYGTFTLYGKTFQSNFNFTNEDSKFQAYYTTSPPAFLQGIQFVLHRFRSPLLTVSHLLSLPLPTKMFQFGRFPLLTRSTTHKVYDKKSH